MALIVAHLNAGVILMATVYRLVYNLPLPPPPFPLPLLRLPVPGKPCGFCGRYKHHFVLIQIFAHEGFAKACTSAGFLQHVIRKLCKKCDNESAPSKGKELDLTATESNALIFMN